MAIEKQEAKKLTDEELEKASGGFAGYNKYSKNEYHDAGFDTDFGAFHPDMCCLSAGPTLQWGNWVSCKYIDKYVDYYRSHTLEEYVNYIRTSYFNGCPEYVYYRGCDFS